MSKLIQKLSPKVVKKLRSDIAFLNVAHCVEELVLNAVDAGASCIAVNLNLPFYQMQVVDNGCGIDAEQMKIIGTRYATSKCHTLEDLQTLKSGGFRGEALSSLKEVSSVLMIESRSASSADTYCKIFTQGKALDPTKSLNSRPSKGTTVTVYDFMYNMPVRRKNISDALDLEDCRKLLQSIALMYPNISFTLKNEATGEMYLQLKKCSSLYHSFLQIFGKSKASNLKNINYETNGYEISGCISTDCFISKDLQFLYVNKRHVLRTKLHKLINNILNKVLSSKQKSTISSTSSTSDSASPSKNQSYCIFAINISCPYDKYDIIFEPRKTMIEFSDWDLVIKLVEDALTDFLKKENLYSSSDNTELNQNVVIGKNTCFPNFQVQDCQQGLFSNIVSRLNFLDQSFMNVKENIEKTPVNNEEQEDINLELNKQNSNFPFKDLSKVNLHVESMQSSNLESCVDIINTKSNISEIDNHVSGVKETNLYEIDSHSVPLSNDTALDIPSRSVFPSDNPVMLRVPEKSVLSHLQTDSSNSNFLKLKDKLKGFVYRSSYPLNGGKHQKNFEKVSVQLNGPREKFPLEKESALSSPLSQINIEKYETKLKECSEKMMLTKSSQCPSVSGNHQNLAKSNADGRIVVKETKDKSFQCPSVTNEKEKRVVSRFVFEEKSNPLNPELLKGSKWFQRKALKKSHSENTEVRDILSETGDSNVFKSKRLKSFDFNQHTGDIVKNAIQQSKNSKIDFEGLSIDSNSFDIHEGELKSSNDIDNFEFVNPTSIFVDSDTINPNIPNKCKPFETGSFDLQCFKKGRSLKECTNNISTIVELKNNSVIREEVCQEKEIETCGSYNKINIPKTSFYTISDDIIKTVTDIEQRVCYLTDSDSFKSSVAEDILMECEISHKKDSAKDKLNPSTLIPNTSNLVCNTMGSSTSNEEESVPCLSNEICFESNGIPEGMEVELPHPSLQNEVNVFPLISVNESKLSNVYSDNGSLESLQCDSNFEFNPFTEKLPSNEASEVELPFSNLQNEVNVVPFIATIESKLANVHSDNCSLESSQGDLHFESDPFTEKLPSNLENSVSQRKDDSLKNTEFSVKEDQKSKILETTSDLNVKTVSPGSTVIHRQTDSANGEAYSFWKLNSQSQCKRKIFIDSVTGNSSYIDPDLSKLDVKKKENSEGNLSYIDPDLGKSDAERKKEAHEGDFKKSHFFLTHDYSPFLKTTQSPVCSKNNTCDVHYKLENFVESNEMCEWNKKWRIHHEDLDSTDNLENMLNRWNNPMFDIPYEVTTAVDGKFYQNIPQMCCVLSSYRFFKKSLDTLQVIGQVDCKFIACVLKDFNENCSDKKLLTLFDQHAVHERIRLEELTEDLYEVDENGKKSIKMSSVNPLELSFSDDETRLLRSYKDKLESIGICIKMDNGTNVCAVTAVPLCLVHKDSGDLRRSLSDTTNILQNVITEWLSSVVKTRSVSQVLPKTLLSVLNYQACRGAVKFGDPLTLEQCNDLMKSLSSCKLPFQCAHGRPSIAPILDLKKIESLYKKKPPPNLRKLLRSHE